MRHRSKAITRYTCHQGGLQLTKAFKSLPSKRANHYRTSDKADNNEGQEYDFESRTFHAKTLLATVQPNQPGAAIQHVNEVVFEYEPSPIQPTNIPTHQSGAQKIKKTEITIMVVPLSKQGSTRLHKEELAALIHYGMNTYTNSEWGNGKEDLVLQSNQLDTDQGIHSPEGNGLQKRTIMVVTTTDSACYPSKYTNHTGCNIHGCSK